jgi:glycogen operon protein
MAFTKRLISLRQQYPILRRGRFLTGAFNDELGLRDVSWVNADGAEMTPEVWQDGNTRCFGMIMDGRAQATGIRRAASDATLLWIMNAYHDVVGFTLPDVVGGTRWSRIFDTNAPDLSGDSFETGHLYEVTGRSCLLFVRGD